MPEKTSFSFNMSPYDGEISCRNIVEMLKCTLGSPQMKFLEAQKYDHLHKSIENTNEVVTWFQDGQSVVFLLSP